MSSGDIIVELDMEWLYIRDFVSSTTADWTQFMASLHFNFLVTSFPQIVFVP